MAARMTFKIGGMWESPEWEVLFNKKVEYSHKPCTHCTDIKIDPKTDCKTWRCPRIIKVYNEGGYNSTGLCLDCVLEAFPR